MQAQGSGCLFLVSSFSTTFYFLVRFCIEMLTRLVVSPEDFAKSDATSAYLALQKMKLLAGRCSEEGETRGNRDLKFGAFPLEGTVAVPCHLWKPFPLLLCCLPAVNPESVSNFICARFTQSLLISLKGDCLIFPFACFHF